MPDDYITCRLCAKDFQVISWSHLVMKHGWELEGAVERYRVENQLQRTTCVDAIQMMRARIIERFERSGRRWTRDRVVRVLRGLSEAGSSLQQEEHRSSSLLNSAFRLFGGWSEALIAAGLDPRDGRERIEWTRERVVEGIRALGKPMRFDDAQREVGRLAAAAYRHFGSWLKACRAAGFIGERHPIAPSLRSSAGLV